MTPEQNEILAEAIAKCRLFFVNELGVPEADLDKKQEYFNLEFISKHSTFIKMLGRDAVAEFMFAAILCEFSLKDTISDANKRKLREYILFFMELIDQ